MMTLTQATGMAEWIKERLASLEARPDTVAYVVGVLSSKDLARLLDAGSIVLAYAGAGLDFEAHRRLADGVLAAEVAFRGWLAEPELCVRLASSSYATCWRLLNRAWPCFEELSARLPAIISVARAAWPNAR